MGRQKGQKAGESKKALEKRIVEWRKVIDMYSGWENPDPVILEVLEQGLRVEERKYWEKLSRKV